jgi:hypothetical protein
LREYVLIDFENVQPATVGGLEPGACGILLFLGEKQAKVSVDLMQALQRFGEAVEVIRIAGSGPNAVDFHIAYTIGRLAQAHPGAGFTIVSRDTGFDPLVRHVTAAGITCRRVASLGTGAAAAAKPRPAAAKIAPGKAAPAKAAAARPAAAKATQARKAPAKGAVRNKTVQQVIKRVIAESRPSAPVAASPATNGRAGEVVARLKGLKAARPRRLKTLQSSIASWFKPALSEAEVAALVRQLSDAGHLSVSDGKVVYAIK